MITIDLSFQSNLRHVISYSVSPLFELAASLRLLAQPNSHSLYAQWVDGTLKTLVSEGLVDDWEYFAPVFTHSIPDFFDPLRTQGVMAVDDQYDYFVTVPISDFRQSLHACLKQMDKNDVSMGVITDLANDPDYVKSRFTLFISSYWQLVFEAKWEEIAPRFVREAEEIERALQGIDLITSYFQSIIPKVIFNEPLEQIEFHLAETGLVNANARSFVLYPSLLHTVPPAFSVHGNKVYLLYNCIERKSS